MKKILSFFLKGKRFIMISGGYSNKGQDTEIKIGIITSIISEKVSKKEWFPKISIGINQYGYDLSEENYVRGFYTWGSYSLSNLVKIYLAQPLLRNIYTNVDIDKNPIDFYQSEKNLQELLS